MAGSSALGVGLAALSSCALLYDFEGGAGGSGGGASSGKGTIDATSTAAVAVAVSATTGSMSGSTSTGGWCRDDLCFGAGCADSSTCNEREFSLAGKGQRVHIDPDGPSVATLVYEPNNKALGFAIATDAGLVSSPPLHTLLQVDESQGFVSHDDDDVAFSVQHGGPKPHPTFYVYDRQAYALRASARMDQGLPYGSAGVLNGVEPYQNGWVAVAGQQIMTIGGTNTLTFGVVHTPLVGSSGHALVRAGPSTFAYSFYAAEGCIGAVVDTDGTWTLGGCSVQPVRPQGIAVADGDIFYVAQRSDPNLQDIVGAVSLAGRNPRVVAFAPAVSAAFVAVDATNVYFDAGAAGLYACPRDAVDLDANLACTRPIESPVGGLASSLLAPGTADERWLVCYTLDDVLHCRVTPPHSTL